ncbi:MAG: hypothetical protein NVS4B3_20090 [Gemmatimonadaceae bacterium]
MRSPRTTPSSSGRPTGFTIVEMLVVIVILGIVTGSILQTLAQQQRFYRATSELVTNRAQLRDATFILPADLRGLSSVGSDLHAMGASSVEFLANNGSSFACAIDPTRKIVDLPPLKLTSGNALTAWISQPGLGDRAYIYDDNGVSGNAGTTWDGVGVDSVVATTSATVCPTSAGFIAAADAAAPRYQLFLSTALAPTVLIGSPIRFTHAERYSLYQNTADQRWYLGYEDCAVGTVNSCTGLQPVSGPFQAAPSGGATFKYYDNTGTATVDSSKVARIDVVLRTQTRSTQEVYGIGGRTQVQDSVLVSVAVRNRV